MNSKIQGKKSKQEGKKVEEDEWEDEEVGVLMDTEETAPIQGGGSQLISSMPESAFPEDMVTSTEPPGEEEDVIL